MDLPSFCNKMHLRLIQCCVNQQLCHSLLTHSSVEGQLGILLILPSLCAVFKVYFFYTIYRWVLFYIQFDILPLLIKMFRSFILNAIINMVKFKFIILLFVLFSSSLFFLFSFFPIYFGLIVLLYLYFISTTSLFYFLIDLLFTTYVFNLSQFMFMHFSYFIRILQQYIYISFLSFCLLLILLTFYGKADGLRLCYVKALH